MQTTEKPSRRRRMASARPAMPAPMMTTSLRSAAGTGAAYLLSAAPLKPARKAYYGRRWRDLRVDRDRFDGPRPPEPFNRFSNLQRLDHDRSGRGSGGHVRHHLY